MKNSKSHLDNCFNLFKKFFETDVLPHWKTGFRYFKDLKEFNIFNLNHEKQGYIRDPIWGEIRLNKLELEILDSFFVQRLRDITQMGGIKFVYPAANHKRFDHSLGTFAAISFILDERILKRRQESFSEKIDLIIKQYKLINPELADKFENLVSKDTENDFEKREVFRVPIILNMKIAMLMHDIGHYPFSHLFENLLKRNQNIVRKYRENYEDFIKNPHELRSKQIILGTDPVLKSFIGNDLINAIKNKIQKLELDVNLISNSITGDSRFVLSRLINGVIDADKLDYLTRDNYFAIASFPLNVFDRIYRKVKFKQVGEEEDIRMVFDEKAISAILKVIINRNFEFNDIINHPVSLCFQGMFNACLERIFQLYSTDKQIEILKRMELMNDHQLVHSMVILANKDKITNDLLYRITYRKLYKQVGYLQKSDLPNFIKLMEVGNKDSFFIDADSLRNCLSDDRIYSSDLHSLINELEKNNSGILFFFNEEGKPISEYFKKIWIESDDNEVVSLDELVNKRYVNQFEALLNYDSDDDKSVSDLFDFFNILENKIYIYVAKSLLIKTKIFFETLKKDKNELKTFFTEVAECLPTLEN